MNTVQLPGAPALPALGLGTWRMGESPRSRAAEVAAVRRAIETGYRVMDTAEMYGEGGAEQVVGRAIAEAVRAGDVRREDLFIVSKVYPHNANRAGMKAACERSLKRLGLDCIDLYLLHWAGPHPLKETIDGFETLQSAGHIHDWGVSNFDLSAMRELHAVPGGERCAANQVYYSLSQRGIEFDLLPWQRERSMLLMAYCPLDQGALREEPVLARIGQRRGVTPSQVALAWLMSRQGVMAIPKAVARQHLQDNFAAADLRLDDDDLAEVDARFPAPLRKTPLAMR